MSNTVEQLRKEIHDAFAWRPCPKDEELGRRGPGYHEGERVAALLRGKQWQDLSLEDILGSNLWVIDLCADMTSQAFVYFLPAFLTVFLDLAADNTRSYDLAESVLFYLIDPDYRTRPEHLAILAKFNDPLLVTPPSPAVRDRFAQITSSLTPRETLAVIHILEFLAEEYERLGISISDDTNTPKEALASYWGKLREEDLQHPQDEK